MKHGTIQINQTLHGYKNGHELISGSVDLPLASKRRMLVLSDLSGTNVQKGFKEYYTGYPLKEANAYALAKSWYAPEMERPGCVWTHTFIIAYADLALINNAEDLIFKFRRPNKDDNNFEEYSSPLDIFLENTLESIKFQVPDNLIKRVISELYNQKNKSVLIADEDNSTWDELLLNIWLQQWPRLRRSFTFCTGAISPRYFEKELFELQVISNLARYDSVVTTSSVTLIQGNNEKVEAIYPTWVEEIFKDLKCPSYLRKFLRKFGTDFTGYKPVVSSLVRTYLFFNYSLKIGLKESLDFLAINYPKKSEANSLKLVTLFNDGKSNEFRIPAYPLTNVLEELTTTKSFLSFDFEKLEISKRFSELYEIDRGSFLQLVNILINRYINSYGELLLIKAAEIINAEDVAALLRDNISVFFTLEGINSKYCYDETIWKKLERHQQEYLSIIFKSNERQPINWKKIVHIVLKIRANISPETFTERKISIVPHVLNYVQKENNDLDYKWFIDLKYHPQEVLSWLDQNEVDTLTFLHFVLSILNPNSSEVNNSNSQTWIRLLVKFPVDAVLNSFVMAVSFHKNSTQALELLELTFDNVYDALYYDKIDYETWRYLEMHTQPLNFFNDWDKCKKLINAVAKFWVDKNIGEDNIARISTNKEISKKILTKIKKFKSKNW